MSKTLSSIIKVNKKNFKILKKHYELLLDKAKGLDTNIENLIMRNQILEEL